ncbi:DNA-binding MarR family transcriptional regulator [Aeromicrobium sp. SORGH_AS981]|uniref:MarR family winged helix-turn-helix transcriptional regulator n=1 Tax=Aeromicrobium sp. SORGH_AS_0981 TaxID=3041802 RepID=UPI002866FFB6|nr:MarR family winged helix-turn-helix transcriptional regulator [Aeromicrobium sp. SORGH_AS_0981]MDR6117825.1 DNA-binding MarR family transcriptional regulator [Aeromicrobium sp. SORGH_AS_0981]
MSQNPPAVSRADLGQALGAVLRRYLDAAHDVVADLPGGARGFQVLTVAGSESCNSQAMIAADLGIDRTVMTYLVDDLERAALVERRPDPADRRARRVVLLAEGERVLRETSQRIEEVERTVLGGLSDADAETFRTLLARVAEGSSADPSLCTGDVPQC